MSVCPYVQAKQDMTPNELDALIDDMERLGLDPDRLKSLAEPAVQMRCVESVGFSRLGGTPDLPPDVDWPLRPANEDGPARPLSFLAQIDLGELVGKPHRLPLPSSGRLWFFYDVEAAPWGFDPRDRGSFAVVGATGDAPLVARAAPPGTETFPGTGVVFEAGLTLPDVLTLIDAFGADDALAESMFDVCEGAAANLPCHQIGGRAQVIQNPMELQCAMVSDGVYLGEPAELDPSDEARYAADAQQWRLLLQLTTDDARGFMWGDMGNIYFWMREADIRAKAWDQAWLLLQCS